MSTVAGTNELPDVTTSAESGNGGVTVRFTLFPAVAPAADAVAVIVTVPGSMPLTNPVELTSATADDDVVQTTVAVNGLPY